MSRLALGLAVAALAAPAAASPPAPPPPMPLVLAEAGTDPARLAFSTAAADAWRNRYGLAPTAMRAGAFSGCLEGQADGRVACLRHALRQERVRVREVGVIVLVSPGDDGGVRWRCLGAARNGEPLRPEAQHPTFDASAEPSSASVQQRAEDCIGGAFAEYMIP